jgi:Niemann-Pick C1 protein
MSNTFANDMFDSCKDVQMPSANDKAISLFCGRKAADCNPVLWLSYMGNTGNGRAPFPILYHFSDSPWIGPDNQTYLPLNVTNLRCNVTYPNITDPCSCQDCQTSCAPMPPPPPAKKPFTILGIDGSTFIVGCMFIAFIIFFGTYVICYSIVKKDSLGIDSEDFYSVENGSRSGSQQDLLKRQVSPAEIGTAEKMGKKFEDFLTWIFTKWGKWCASYPIIVLIVTIIIFGSFAGGIARYNVTTDPVKLWSSPQSTARKHKDYFDSHFGYVYVSINFAGNIFPIVL